MSSFGWAYMQDPRPPFAGANPNPSEKNGSRTRLIHNIFERLDQNRIVCVSISGKRGMGKTALIDFVAYAYSESRLVVSVGDVVFSKSSDVCNILQRIYEDLNGTGTYDSWEKIREQVKSRTETFFVIKLRLFDEKKIKGEFLSLFLCYLYGIFRTAKVLVVLEQDAPAMPFQEICKGQKNQLSHPFGYTYLERDDSLFLQVYSPQKKRRVRKSDPNGPKEAIPLVDLEVHPLTSKDAEDFLVGKEGDIHLAVRPRWTSDRYGNGPAKCKRGDPCATMLHWSGYHPMMVQIARSRCKDCRANGGPKCDKNELKEKRSGPALFGVRESLRQDLKSRRDKRQVLMEWGFLTNDNQIAGVVKDIYCQEVTLKKFIKLMRSLGIELPVDKTYDSCADNQELKMRSESLRDLLKPLDDVAIDALCNDYFPSVADKFSRGLRRDEKINLLLDHCRRNPEECKRLPLILRKITSRPTLQKPENSDISQYLDCILIVTVNDAESEAVLDTFSPNQRARLFGAKTYFYLSIHGNVPVLMVRSEQGIATVGGAQSTITQAIQDLKPQAVIMCGVAYGLSQDTQQLGDILVSKRILHYEPQKIDLRKGPIPRGDRVTCSERLLDRFRSGVADWRGAPTHFGLMLSGEKLVNDSDFCTQLLEQEPEAMGVEMEGAGLYVAAQSASVDWILVKAICGWADGSKNDEAQSLAATNAAKFVLHVVGLGGWRNPQR